MIPKFLLLCGLRILLHVGASNVMALSWEMDTELVANEDQGDGSSQFHGWYREEHDCRSSTVSIKIEQCSE